MQKKLEVKTQISQTIDMISTMHGKDALSLSFIPEVDDKEIKTNFKLKKVKHNGYFPF